MYMSIITLSLWVLSSAGHQEILFKTMAHLPSPFHEAFRNKVSMEKAQPSLGLEMLSLNFRAS